MQFHYTFVFWLSLFVGCVFSRPELYHENYEDGKNSIKLSGNALTLNYKSTTTHRNDNRHEITTSTLDERQQRQNDVRKRQHKTTKTVYKKRYSISKHNPPKQHATKRAHKDNRSINTNNKHKINKNAKRSKINKTGTGTSRYNKHLTAKHIDKSRKKKSKINHNKKHQLLKRSQIQRKSYVDKQQRERKRTISKNQKSPTEKKSGNYKKGNVFLFDSSKLGDDGSIGTMFGHGGSRYDDMIQSPADDSTMTGERKDSIDQSSPTTTTSDSNIEGSNPELFEQNIITKSDENNGNLLPIEPGGLKSLDAAALESNIPAEIEFLKGSGGGGNANSVSKDSSEENLFPEFKSSSKQDRGEKEAADMPSVEQSLMSEFLDQKGTKETTKEFSLPKKQASTVVGSNEKSIDSVLEPVDSAAKYKSFMDTAASVKADPDVSKAINADNSLDESIKDAIKAQMKADVELATGVENSSSANANAKTRSTEMKYKKKPKKPISLVGDISSVAEVIDKAAMNRLKNPRHSKSSKNSKKKKKKIQNTEIKLQHSTQQMKTKQMDNPPGENTKASTANEENAKEQEPPTEPTVNLNQQEQTNAINSDLDINTHPSALTQSEQDLITTIDRAARKKDVASEVVTRVMMPTLKNDAFSDQTIAPTEQLLDMLSNGKFSEPLPENVLDKLASMDPNQAFLREQGGFFGQATGSGRSRLMQVGSEVLPVRSVALPSMAAKPAEKSLIDAKNLVKARQMMQTNPYVLAQNSMLLDAHNYKSLQDLSHIGESIFPSNMIDLKQPVLLNSPQSTTSGGNTYGEASNNNNMVLAGTANAEVRCPNCGHGHVFNHVKNTAGSPPVKFHEETHFVKNSIDPLILEKIRQLPKVNVEKILKSHRKKHPATNSFPELISDTTVQHNTDDEFIPQQTIRLPEEHKNRESIFYRIKN